MNEAIPHDAAAVFPAAVEPPPRRASLFRVAAVAGVVVVLLAGLAAAGVLSRSRQLAARDTTMSVKTERMRVLTAKAELAPTGVEQVLPGSASPMLETAVFARTSGYLRRRHVDIGDRVTEGQLLAEIESPEVDAQLLQTRASLAESQAVLERNKASEALAKLNLDRLAGLVRTLVATQQEYDEADAASKVASATVRVTQASIAANAANIHRLESLQAFQKVFAPFDGVVTARNFDAGALIFADNAAAKELFHVSRIDTLRVFADVPQSFAAAIRPGQPAPVFRKEAPGKLYDGVIARTTQSVDPRTRTLRVQVDVPNREGALLPGMYLQVRFKLEAPGGTVRVPGAAIVTRASGSKVAILDAGGAVHYRAVQLARDFGSTVEVVDGLTGGETLVVRPGDDLPEGTVVEVVPGAP